jgi:hypothetical protein
MGQREVDVTIKGKDETKGAFSSAAASAKASVADMKSSFGSLGGIMDAVRSHWQLALGVIAGGAMFKEVVDATREWTGDVVSLSKRLGITTQEASGLNVALHHIGMGVDDYGTVVQKMTKQLRGNEDAFHALGIKTKETNGTWRNSQDVMSDAIEKLSKMKEGTDRNIAASTLFGAKVGNISALLRLNKDMLEESRKKAEEYHLVVGPEGAAKVRAYKDTLADLHLVGTSLEVQLGTALLPVLTSIGMEFSKHGPEFTAGFGKALKFVATAALEGYAAINALVQGSHFLNVVLSTPINGNYLRTVTTAMHAMGEQVTKVNEGVSDSILKIRGFGGERGTPSARPGGGTLGGGDSPEDLEKAHEKYLAKLHKEVELLVKARELGELRLSDMRRAIELQEQMLALAGNRHASVEDRVAARAAANSLEKVIPFAAAAAIATTPDASSDKAKLMPHIGQGDLKPIVPPEIATPAVKFTDDLAAGFDKATARIFGTIDAVHTLGEDIGEVAVGAISDFAASWGDATEQIVQGSLSVGQAIANSARHAVGAAASAKGSETLLDAGKAFAQGFHDPSQFPVAARLFAIGTGYKALAGALGGGGAGSSSTTGGGGGLSSAGFQQSAAATEKLGNVTVILKGSKLLLDPADAESQDNFIGMIKTVAGNRNIDFTYEPNG